VRQQVDNELSPFEPADGSNRRILNAIVIVFGCLDEHPNVLDRRRSGVLNGEDQGERNRANRHRWAALTARP
jgi:hypothetical protein